VHSMEPAIRLVISLPNNVLFAVLVIMIFLGARRPSPSYLRPSGVLPLSTIPPYDIKIDAILPAPFLNVLLISPILRETAASTSNQITKRTRMRDGMRYAKDFVFAIPRLHTPSYVVSTSNRRVIQNRVEAMQSCHPGAHAKFQKCMQAKCSSPLGGDCERS